MQERTAADVVREARGQEPLVLLTSVHDYCALLKGGAAVVSCLPEKDGTHVVLRYDDLCFAYVDSPARARAH